MGKLRKKIAHNLDLGLGAFVKKGVRFAADVAKSHLLLRGVNRLGVGVRVIGVAPKINNPGGRIELGDDVIFAAPLTPIYLDLRPNAVLTVGDETYMNDAVWFGCTERITIGARVLIGPGVRIFDNSYHGLYERHTTPAARPVTIEDDVWIASDCIIMPGVTIGRGAVIAAHTVVLKDVPPYAVMAGNPGVIIRKLDGELFGSAAE